MLHNWNYIVTLTELHKLIKLHYINGAKLLELYHVTLTEFCYITLMEL